MLEDELLAPVAINVDRDDADAVDDAQVGAGPEIDEEDSCEGAIRTSFERADDVISFHTEIDTYAVPVFAEQALAVLIIEIQLNIPYGAIEVDSFEKQRERIVDIINDQSPIVQFG